MPPQTLFARVRLIFFTLALFFSATAFAQSTASPPWQTFAGLDERPRSLVAPDVSRLLFLRPRSPQDTSLPVDIWLDGRFHTAMLAGSFSDIQVCPGKQQIELGQVNPTAASPKIAVTVVTLARQTVYVLVQNNAGQVSQTVLSPAQAQALLPELRRQSHAVSRVAPMPVCQPEPVAPVVAAPVVAAPVVVAPVIVPAPAPIPVAVTAAPEPMPARYTLSAEMLFNFAGSQPEHLSEQGQTQILRLGKRIKEQLKPGQVILVQGHTDPMGSAALNQRLSLERAQTVSRILVNSGLPAQQLRAEGLGNSQLLVKNCQQTAQTRDAKLNCNRPNRRVEITVNPAKN